MEASEEERINIATNIMEESKETETPSQSEVKFYIIMEATI